MEKRHMAAALLLPLVLIAPAAAQGPADVRSSYRVIEGPSYLPPPESRTPHLPLQGSSVGFSISAAPMVEEDGSTVYKKALIGSMPLSGNARVGVGLIEVTRMSNREQAVRRIRPMSDTGGESDRIAAVGLSISF
jgi:hypothetical protein